MNQFCIGYWQGKLCAFFFVLFLILTGIISGCANPNSSWPVDSATDADRNVCYGEARAESNSYSRIDFRKYDECLRARTAR